MNVLWDLRLFSYGYRNRGVGRYCKELIGAILSRKPEMTLYVWADRGLVPESLREERIRWIPYSGGTWKKSIVTLPWLVLRHHIHLIHYWVALGPLRQIGIAPFSPAPAVATVYDLGVELWDTPYLNYMRSEMSWRMQKRFFRSVKGWQAISQATLDDLSAFFPHRHVARDVIYMPLNAERKLPSAKNERARYFITLAGSPHKNCSRVVAAFAKIRVRYPDWQLKILGELNGEEEGVPDLPEGVVHDPSMDRYEEHLMRCGGLVYCSVNEGLGVPAIDAMQYGCPLLLSSIPSLKEICSGVAVFADPLSVDSMAQGMEVLVKERQQWESRSKEGADVYRRKGLDAPDRCLEMYGKITGCRVSFNIR